MKQSRTTSLESSSPVKIGNINIYGMEESKFNPEIGPSDGQQRSPILALSRNQSAANILEKVI